MDKKFVFYSGVQLIKGYSKALLMNINNGHYKHIELEIYYTLVDIENIRFSEFNEEIKKLINHLVKENWGVLTHFPENFRKIDIFDFETPNLISNAIVDVRSNYLDYLDTALIQLTKLGCKAYQLRIYDPISINILKVILEKLNGVDNEFFQIMLKLQNKEDIYYLQEMEYQFYVYDYKDEINLKDIENIEISKTELLPHENCGFVNNFAINIKHFTESINFNTCLNKKVGIDINGNIKNCPSNKTSFGNIMNENLKEIVLSEDFQRQWKISKNFINVCNVCEYRNVCIDCRVFTENNGELEKPSKCNYNPFTGEWKKMFTALLIFFIFLPIQTVRSQKYIPFDINEIEFQWFKKADSLFKIGSYSEACKYYGLSKKIIEYFPNQMYKYSITLWLNGDTTNARKEFYFAAKRGLKFPNVNYFNNSPLIKDMSINILMFDYIKNTTLKDSLAIFPIFREKLIEMKNRDQKYRSGGVAEDGEFVSQSKIDSMLELELENIIKIIGWPGINEVGYLGENSSFLIAQHSDNNLEFQKKCLDLMLNEFEAKNISVNFLAMLIDRYLINIGQDQIFGSQVVYNEKNKIFIVKPCKYIKDLNYLRSLYDLEPIDDYLVRMNNKYKNK